LGYCYEHGLGSILKDNKKAAKYLSLSAAQDYAWARADLETLINEKIQDEDEKRVLKEIKKNCEEIIRIINLADEDGADENDKKNAEELKAKVGKELQDEIDRIESKLSPDPVMQQEED